MQINTKLNFNVRDVASFLGFETLMLVLIVAVTWGSNVPLSKTDSEFAKKAAQGGMAEVKLGQLAQSKGQSEAVKNFGKRMESDHGKAGEELQSIASREHLDLPAEIDKEDQANYDRLSKLSGKEFDREYVNLMVDDHQKDVSEFKREVQTGQDDAVKSFAVQTLPTIQEHLQMIRKIQKDIASQNASAM